jgi:Ala-tRNA(Pro) deacylase
MNDLRRQPIYSHNGLAVVMAMVAGRWFMRDGARAGCRHRRDGLICERHSRTSGRQQTTTRGTMAATPADLFALFDRLAIEHSTTEHPPFFTVEEGRPWHDRIPGLHGKNLFIKDRKGGIWLVVMPADKRADLGRLEKALCAPRFSFARPDVLQEVLALTPGSVTPFGLINDAQRRVTVILDEEILESEWVNFHPLHNAASTTLRSADLLRFVRALGYEPIVVCLPAAPADD